MRFQLTVSSYEYVITHHLGGPTMCPDEFESVCEKNICRLCKDLLPGRKLTLEGEEIIATLAEYLCKYEGFTIIPDVTTYDMFETEIKALPTEVVGHNNSASRIYQSNRHDKCFCPHNDIYLLNAYEAGYSLTCYGQDVDILVGKEKFYGKFATEYERGVRDGALNNCISWTRNDWLGVCDVIFKEKKQ